MIVTNFSKEILRLFDKNLYVFAIALSTKSPTGGLALYDTNPVTQLWRIR